MFNNIAKFKYIFIALILLIMLNLKADNGVRLGAPSQITNPKHVKDGIVFTNQNGSALYLLKDNKVEELLSFPNCGGYYVSPEKTKIGLKITDTTDWQQTPVVYDLITRKITKLNEPARRYSRVSFSENGKMAYLRNDILYVHAGRNVKEFNIGSYHISPISPDGHFIIYKNTEQGLSIINTESGEIKDVNIGFKHDFYASEWSPDSKKFIFYMSGAIFTYDMITKSSYKIIKDKGYSDVVGKAYWYDSDYLVSSQTKITQNETIESHELYLTKYDATNEIKLTNSPKLFEILSSVNLETKEILYHTGEQKELITTKLNNSKLLNRNVLFKADDNFRRKIFKKKSLKNEKNEKKIDNVPYINQKNDTPDMLDVDWYNGLYYRGGFVCAPTCSAMLLAYYGILPPCEISITEQKLLEKRVKYGHPTADVGDLDDHTDNWGHYIINEFFYRGNSYDLKPKNISDDGLTYSDNGNIKDGHIGLGLDAWINRDNGHGGSNAYYNMQYLFNDLGYTTTRVDKPTFAEIKAEIDSGFPILYGTGLYKPSLLHVVIIVGYDESNGMQKLICHDPYGDLHDSDSPYKKWNIEGNEVEYLFEGSNSDNDHEQEIRNRYMVTVRPQGQRHFGFNCGLEIENTDYAYDNQTFDDDEPDYDDYSSDNTGFYLHNEFENGTHLMSAWYSGFNTSTKKSCWMTSEADYNDYLYATWRPKITQEGWYDVYAYIPADFAMFCEVKGELQYFAPVTNARYRVYYGENSDGEEEYEDVIINQEDNAGKKVFLGTYRIYDDYDPYVYLGDATFFGKGKRSHKSKKKTRGWSKTNKYVYYDKVAFEPSTRPILSCIPEELTPPKFASKKSEHKITITNEGGSALEWEIIRNDKQENELYDWMSFSEECGYLKAHHSTEVTVYIDEFTTNYYNSNNQSTPRSAHFKIRDVTDKKSKNNIFYLMDISQKYTPPAITQPKLFYEFLSFKTDGKNYYRNKLSWTEAESDYETITIKGYNLYRQTKDASEKKEVRLNYSLIKSSDAATYYEYSDDGSTIENASYTLKKKTKYEYTLKIVYEDSKDKTEREIVSDIIIRMLNDNDNPTSTQINNHVFIDNKGDFLDDDWERQYFGSLTHALATTDANPDLDSVNPASKKSNEPYTNYLEQKNNTDPNDNNNPRYLKISQTEINATTSGTLEEIELKNPGKLINWKTEINYNNKEENWITVDPATGSCGFQKQANFNWKELISETEIKLKQNDSGSDRNAIIKFICTDFPEIITKEINVKQDFVAPCLLLNKTKIDAIIRANTYPVTLSNPGIGSIKWKTEIIYEDNESSDWITLSKYSGDCSSTGNNINIIIADNGDDKIRKATILFKSVDGFYEADVEITQSNDHPQLTMGTEFTYSFDKEGKMLLPFKLFSDNEWYIEVRGSMLESTEPPVSDDINDWISFHANKTEDPKTPQNYFYLKQNMSGERRHARIKFRWKWRWDEVPVVWHDYLYHYVDIYQEKNPDLDNDGLPDEWEYSFFSGTGVPETARSYLYTGGDYDNDGSNDEEEWQRNTVPTDPNSYYQCGFVEVNPLRWNFGYNGGSKFVRMNSLQGNYKTGSNIEYYPENLWSKIKYNATSNADWLHIIPLGKQVASKNHSEETGFILKADKNNTKSKRKAKVYINLPESGNGNDTHFNNQDFIEVYQSNEDGDLWLPEDEWEFTNYDTIKTSGVINNSSSSVISNCSSDYHTKQFIAGKKIQFLPGTKIGPFYDREFTANIDQNIDVESKLRNMFFNMTAKEKAQSMNISADPPEILRSQKQVKNYTQFAVDFNLGNGNYFLKKIINRMNWVGTLRWRIVKFYNGSIQDDDPITDWYDFTASHGHGGTINTANIPLTRHIAIIFSFTDTYWYHIGVNKLGPNNHSWIKTTDTWENPSTKHTYSNNTNLNMKNHGWPIILDLQQDQTFVEEISNVTPNSPTGISEGASGDINWYYNRDQDDNVKISLCDETGKITFHTYTNNTTNDGNYRVSWLIPESALGYNGLFKIKVEGIKYYAEAFSSPFSITPRPEPISILHPASSVTGYGCDQLYIGKKEEIEFKFEKGGRVNIFLGKESWDHDGIIAINTANYSEKKDTDHESIYLWTVPEKIRACDNQFYNEITPGDDYYIRIEEVGQFGQTAKGTNFNIER